MTTDERADQIETYILRLGNSGSIIPPHHIKDFVSAEIHEAVLEAFDNKWKNEHKRCLEIAKAEAYDHCLRIAKDFTGQGQCVYEEIKRRKEQFENGRL